MTKGNGQDDNLRLARGDTKEGLPLARTVKEHVREGIRGRTRSRFCGHGIIFGRRWINCG